MENISSTDINASQKKNQIDHLFDLVIEHHALIQRINQSSLPDHLKNYTDDAVALRSEILREIFTNDMEV